MKRRQKHDGQQAPRQPRYGAHGRETFQPRFGADRAFLPDFGRCGRHSDGDDRLQHVLLRGQIRYQPVHPDHSRPRQRGRHVEHHQDRAAGYAVRHDRRPVLRVAARPKRHPPQGADALHVHHPVHVPAVLRRDGVGAAAFPALRLPEQMADGHVRAVQSAV